MIHQDVRPKFILFYLFISKTLGNFFSYIGFTREFSEQSSIKEIKDELKKHSKFIYVNVNKSLLAYCKNKINNILNC